MPTSSSVQHFVVGTSATLIIIASFLILVAWGFGKLDLWLLTTDLAVLLLTVGISILIANDLIVSVERRSQYQRARIPMARIADRVRKGVDSVVQFLSATLNDDAFVHDLFGGGQRRLPTADEFRDRIFGHANNPIMTDPEDFRLILSSMERNSERLRRDATIVIPSLSPVLAIALDKDVGNLESGSELLRGPTEPLPTQPPSFETVVFALSQCYGALLGLARVVEQYVAERPQSFLERWPTPDVFIRDIAKRLKKGSVDEPCHQSN